VTESEKNRRHNMETVATVGSVVLLLALAWQILGSVWNIVAIVLGLFRDR
jgi:hypothetical protein